MPRYPKPEYSEFSPNPKFRPSVDHLVTKMRSLKTLDNPDNAEFVINDMIYEYFYHREKRPQAIYRAMMRLNSLWRLALAVPISEEEKTVLASAESEADGHWEWIRHTAEEEEVGEISI